MGSWPVNVTLPIPTAHAIAAIVATRPSIRTIVSLLRASILAVEAFDDAGNERLDVLLGHAIEQTLRTERGEAAGDRHVT
mgnify:CR=1 FL=1